MREREVSGAEDRLRRWVARSTPSPYVDLETGVLRKEVSVDSDVTEVLADNAALRAAGDELAALMHDTANPEDDRPTIEQAMDAIARWKRARAEGGAK